MVVVVTVVLVVVIGAILYARKLADLGLPAARRLRRIPPGTPAAKLEGWRLAYDDVA